MKVCRPRPPLVDHSDLTMLILTIMGLTILGRGRSAARPVHRPQPPPFDRERVPEGFLVAGYGGHPMPVPRDGSRT